MPIKDTVMTDTRRRVKLYALNAERQWDDKGTGHVSSNYVDHMEAVSLLVRAESDGTLLLESKIQPDTSYHKQQDTLIVWSEGDNFDLALSFQEKAGCDEIWEKICQVQGRDPSVDVTQDLVEESEEERYDEVSDVSTSIELPPCEMIHLDEIKEMISSCVSSGMRKDKLAETLEGQNYIRKLINLFHMCEDLNNVDGLHSLFEIFRNIFLLNKSTLYDVMFSDELILDVIGCLEYDPVLPEPKKHREYLSSVSHFKEVIPISNSDLLCKIHQTHRVQYIQDVVLPTPSVFEENMLSSLSSFIFFNKIEIVGLIQEDNSFLPDLLTMLVDHVTPDSKRRDLVMFLKEYYTFAQNLQQPSKEGFFKTLSSLGVLAALEITLRVNDQQTRNVALDILSYIVEYSPSLVRDYALKQAQAAGRTESELTLINVIIEQVNCDNGREMGRAIQLMYNLRLLIDPENMIASSNKTEKTEFLTCFYRTSIHLLTAPLISNTKGECPAKDDFEIVQQLALIIELLTFCVEHHTFHIKNYIISKDLLRRVLVLLKSRHKFLVLASLRFMRKLIGLKDEFYHRYIIKGDLFKSVVDTFFRNRGKYNLLDSAIVEMFEFIKIEDVKSLITYIVEVYGKRLEMVSYVQTFITLRARYNQLQEKLKEKEKNAVNLDSVPSIIRSNRYRKDPRQLDDEEEMWFNDDDDDFEDTTSVPTTGSNTNSINSRKINNELDAIGLSIDKKIEGAKTENKTITSSGKNSPVTNNNLSNDESLNVSEGKCSISVYKKALVDYDGDSDDEEEDSENLMYSKRARYT